MTGGPVTSIDVVEYPREGRAVLTFSACPSPGGAPPAFIEHRLGDGVWRRGDSLEVRRRGIVSRVTCRAVDAAGVAGPEQQWEKDWPGLRAVAYPADSGNWFGTYDWWKFRHHDRWWLDHPVCLVFRAPPCAAAVAPAVRRCAAGRPPDRHLAPEASVQSGPSRVAARVSAGSEPDLVPRIEHILRRLGLRSHLFDWTLLLDRASDGGLSVGRGDPPDVHRPNAFAKGLKRRLSARSLPVALLQAAGTLRSGGLQSSLHVRVYAPEGGCFFDSELGSWAVGTCHLDVNELMAVRHGRLRWGAELPPGAPDPGIGADLIKYGGHSERAADLVAGLWERAFGRRSVTRGAARIGDPQDWFQVQRRGTVRGRSWVMGKWWRSDGCVTLLDLPDR